MINIDKIFLSTQCPMISGLVYAELITSPNDKDGFDKILHWPDGAKGHGSLEPVVQAALRNNQAVVKTRNSQIEKTGEPLDALACPLFVNDQRIGVLAIEMTHRSQSMQRAAVQQVQAGARWLEALIVLHGTTAKEQLINIVDLVAAALEHEQFRPAATAVSSALANRFLCHRVSLGFLRYKRIRVQALSNTHQIDQQSNHIRAIKDAMNESLDQGAVVVYPPTSGDTASITHFHAHLYNRQQGASICTLPLIMNGKAVGALMLERGADNPFDAETVARCEQISLLLGPVLETKRRNERPLAERFVDAARKLSVRLVGPRYLKSKLGIGIAAILLAWLFLASGVLRISCDSVLEAGTRRSIVAPQEGYISEALVRAGDIVREGERLATLDDKELRLEQRKWQGQRAQLLKEYRKALAASDRSEVAILKAKRKQAEAQLKLVEQRLSRTTLTAPFAGLIVKGDLSQALDSPVRPGEVLFEVAPSNDYRVVLKVDDRDIGLVKLGQKGQLKLSGMPDRVIPITINRLMPVSTIEGGRNYFRVEATLQNPSDLMRPGMEGIAKIEIRQERLLRIWTRRLMNWLQLFIWNRMP